MKKRTYIFVAVAAYLILLIATIPASLISSPVNDSGIVTIKGVSGSLWNGKAYNITINNNIEFKNTRWTFSLWKLMTGKVAMNINSQFLENDISAELGSSFSGRVFINDLKAKISAQQIAQLANIPMAQLSGLISIDIDQAQWKQGELPLASGVINWSDAEITVAETASLGNVTITLLESAQQLLQADIKNQGGDIKITGVAELVAEANYAINIKLLPTVSASDNIKQSLGFFAKKQASGEYLLKHAGSLNQIGLI